MLKQPTNTHILEPIHYWLSLSAAGNKKSVKTTEKATQTCVFYFLFGIKLNFLFYFIFSSFFPKRVYFKSVCLSLGPWCCSKQDDELQKLGQMEGLAGERLQRWAGYKVKTVGLKEAEACWGQQTRHWFCISFLTEIPVCEPGTNTCWSEDGKFRLSKKTNKYNK